MSKRSKPFCPLPITVPKPTPRFGVLVGGAFIGMLDKALDQAQLSEIEAMLAHPSATHLWAVIAIALLGVLACAGRRNTAKVRRFGDRKATRAALLDAG